MAAVKVRNEEEATSALPKLPCTLGTIVYCLRTQRTVAARLPSGEIQILDGGIGVGASLPSFRAPYGIAFDSGRVGFWIADKFTHSIRFIRIQDSENRMLAGVLDPNLVYDVSSYPCPCMLDFDVEFGLLAGCFGVHGVGGGVIRLDGSKMSPLTSAGFKDTVTHCCWLPNGAYVYVTRSDAVVWFSESVDFPARPLTAPSRLNMLPPLSGSTDQLHLKYVQGLKYSPSRKALLVADASLGAIYSIDLKKNTFKTLAGQPVLSNSTFRARVRPGTPDHWLGPIRSLGEDPKGKLIWLDGETGSFFSLSERNEIQAIGSALPGNLSKAVAGSGIVCF